MAQGEAPPGSSADPCTRSSSCSAGTSLSASACRSAAEHPRTCARSAPACCGLSRLGRENPNWPVEDEQINIVMMYTQAYQSICSTTEKWSLCTHPISTVLVLSVTLSHYSPILITEKEEESSSERCPIGLNAHFSDSPLIQKQSCSGGLLFWKCTLWYYQCTYVT